MSVATEVTGSSGNPESTTFPVSEKSCPVMRNERVNADYFCMTLSVPEGALRTAAGQFFHLMCPPSERGTPFLRRPMSVYRIDQAANEIAFLYKETGLGTRGLARMEAGDLLNIVGPLGIGFSIPRNTADIVVLGRGVGLATLAPLAELAAERNVGVTAILSARRQELVMSEDRFRAAGADVVALNDEDGSSDVKNVERILRGLHDRGMADAFYTCGSNRLFLLMQRLGAELSIPGEVALEQQMACGMGVCFCCVRSFQVDDELIHRRVCCEGPVFDMQEATGW